MPKGLRIVLAVLAFVVASAVFAGALFLDGLYHNLVRVDIAHAPGTTGFVDLCGRRTPLRRQGQVLSAEAKITCEGSGYARLRLSDGRTAACPIGYVTPGMRLTFGYTLVGASCRRPANTPARRPS